MTEPQEIPLDLDPRDNATVTITVIENGTERPGWALRAGQVINATEYEHAKRKLTVWVEA
jgi:hypothetical protein